jgi:hypothetical protein
MLAGIRLNQADVLAISGCPPTIINPDIKSATDLLLAQSILDDLLALHTSS